MNTIDAADVAAMAKQYCPPRTVTWQMDPEFLQFFPSDVQERMRTGGAATLEEVEQARQQPGSAEAIEAKIQRMWGHRP